MLASASHVAAVRGCLLQDNEMDWIIFVTNANKKNRQPGGVFGQRSTQQSH